MSSPFTTNGGAAGDGGMVRSFSSLERAEAARAAASSSGVPADAIQLQVRQDEAGPVEGNFLVGNGRESPDGSAYEANFAHAVTRGSYLLILAAIPSGRRAEVEAALDELGGVDVDAVASRGGGTSPDGA